MYNSIYVVAVWIFRIILTDTIKAFHFINTDIPIMINSQVSEESETTNSF